jgi:hypothetical protein
MPTAAAAPARRNARASDVDCSSSPALWHELTTASRGIRPLITEILRDVVDVPHPGGVRAVAEDQCVAIARRNAAMTDEMQDMRFEIA